MKAFIKAGSVLLMFAIGNRVYNHDTAWGRHCDNGDCGNPIVFAYDFELIK
jgi:hypothetical protein